MIDVHDYSIIGVEVNPDGNEVTLTLNGPSGEYAGALKLNGVEVLFVDGFSLQNVVLDVKLFSSPEVSFEYKRACELLGLDYSKQALDCGKSIFFIEASVGAEVACLMSGHPQLLIVPE